MSVGFLRSFRSRFAPLSVLSSSYLMASPYHTPALAGRSVPFVTPLRGRQGAGAGVMMTGRGTLLHPTPNQPTKKRPEVTTEYRRCKKRSDRHRFLHRFHVVPLAVLLRHTRSVPDWKEDDKSEETVTKVDGSFRDQKKREK